MLHILKCNKCSKYIIKKTCMCGGVGASPKPPKYSPDDAYGKYRRMAKKEDLTKEGFI